MINQRDITDTLPLTESVWEQGGKTNGPILYNVGLEWSWQKLQTCSNQIVQQSWSCKIWPICKNQKLGEWSLRESDVRWIQWLGRECEHAKWQQLIRLTENLIFQREFLYLVMRVWKWRILARQWRRNDGHQRTDLPGDYPLSHGPTFSFVPSPLARWTNFITSEITVSSTITIITHTWHLTKGFLLITHSSPHNHLTSTQRTHMGSSRCRTPSRKRHRVLRTAKRTGEKKAMYE